MDNQVFEFYPTFMNQAYMLLTLTLYISLNYKLLILMIFHCYAILAHYITRLLEPISAAVFVSSA